MNRVRSFRGPAHHKLMLGVEAQQNRRLDQEVLDVAQPVNNLLIARSGHRIGIFGQDEWRITESLTATAGLRIDRSNFSSTKSSPRAALIWRAGVDTTVKALYGRAHRAPNVFERDFGDGLTQVANLALRSERIDTVELVADHRLTRDLALHAAAYHWTMLDIVTLGSDPASGLSQYGSGAAIRARGLELSADKTWSSGARLRASTSLQQVSQRGGGLPNSPKFLGKLNLSGPLPWAGVRAGYELRYDSARGSLDGTRLGGYALSNLHLSVEPPGTRLALSLGVFNVLDKRYAHPGADTNWQNALAQDGRSVRVKATYGF